MTQGIQTGPRVVALVGPYASGKTTLLENILFMTETTRRRANGERVFGDDSVEAKALSMGVDINLASVHYLGDQYIFFDCPGSVEFSQEMRNAVHAADIAVVVAEPEPEKLQALSPLLRDLENDGIPHLLFINKIDHSNVHIRDLAAALDEVSARPTVLRHIPIREGEEITGYIDLAHKRAYSYGRDGQSELIDMPATLAEQVKDERFHMLETIADFHDELMEELLEDIDPPSDEVFKDLADDMASGRIMPVLMGCAHEGYGLRRLMKALRHEMPGFELASTRMMPKKSRESCAYIFKTRHLPHMGKMSCGRVIKGTISDGLHLGDNKISGLYRLHGTELKKTTIADAGDVVLIPRLEGVATGETLGGTDAPKPQALQPVYSVAVIVEDRKDEVRLSEALTKLLDEDTSYAIEHREDTGQLILWGQGEIHMRAALARLKDKYGVNVRFGMPRVPYKETIRRARTQHSRYKKQSGGHGQFGDVTVEIRPQAPGTGFRFSEHITGGAIPKQYIPSVEAGVKEYLLHGPLGFPVVDVEVELKDGQTHSVDSSDMAFKMAGRMAMAEAMPECDPVLLEPVERVQVMAPTAHMAKINSLVASRRGQILGFNNRQGWPGWEQIDAEIPTAEIQDMIIELRSLTQGTGTFQHEFDHLTEIGGRLKDKVLGTAGAAST
ncbi:elongation factor G [Kordiimonas marina]|uniref:elongation factor G n=1 Tax=Kordiimonas marina TaxID=2872312 RepID=UPI001FF44903|nr:elongation factor G [Kordiimonas marina]MCJ9429123.1 elongation factor G [Kordiimonas marina]